jgi:hypothetical protein
MATTYQVLLNGKVIWRGLTTRDEAVMFAERAVAGRAQSHSQVRTGKRIVAEFDTRGGHARTQPRDRAATRKEGWRDVHAAEKAGHPMAHPRRHVFGA